MTLPMNNNSSWPVRTAKRRDGVALVLILAFIVLLTTLTVAFFSRAMTERQVSNSSAAQTRADLLARSAMDIIVGDFKQEIVAPLASTASTPSPTPTGVPPPVIYAPTLPAYMSPQQSGVPTPSPAGSPGATPPIPNLVRRSVRSDPMVAPGVASRASAVNSTTDASANGRTVNLARWNSHYLIPRHTTTTTIDTTPISPLNTSGAEAYGFTPPDWVMVTSSGPKVLTAPDSTVVGRYAYAVYDEGGMLDANVAGFPLPSPTPSPAGAQAPALKGTLAYADLTAVPASASTFFPQSAINDIVGWRNYATTHPTGTISNGTNYAFDTGVISRYDTYLSALTTGFLTTNPLPSPSPATSNSRTDQIFSSRQALLRFRRAVGFSQNLLQYLGTFSRDLEQPSYVPNPARPRVQNVCSTSSAPTPFGNGNDGYVAPGALPSPALDTNPPFLQVRVATTFTRPDGTTAKVGDPLVLKRFPLSRLSLITSSKTNNAQQTDDIYRNFGFSRGTSTGTSSFWSYNHGGPGAGTRICRLSEVASLGREADFFELLKAGINKGSLGKTSCLNYNTFPWSTSYTVGYIQNSRDVLTDLQILQIGANIIDQSKSDNFPTRIQFSGNSNYEVRGVEDLPYFYQWRNWAMQTGPSTGVLMWQPELWNPHSLGSSANVPSGASPTNFRFRVAKDSTATTTSPIGVTLYYDSTASTPHDYSSVCTLDFGNPLPSPLTFNAGEANGYWGFSGTYITFVDWRACQQSSKLHNVLHRLPGKQLWSPHRIIISSFPLDESGRCYQSCPQYSHWRRSRRRCRRYCQLFYLRAFLRGLPGYWRQLDYVRRASRANGQQEHQ